MKGREMQKVTRWFPGRIKPVRSGVYQQMCGRGVTIGYQYWDGKAWHLWMETPNGAYAERLSAPVPFEYQNDKWRGLFKEQPCCR